METTPVTKYQQPLEDLFWRMATDLRMGAADAQAVIERVGGTRAIDATSNAAQSAKIVRTLVSVVTADQVSAQLGIRWGCAAVAEALGKNRRDLFVLGCVLKHWDWLMANNVKRKTVLEVTYLEWQCFESNPFVLTQHSVPFDVLVRRPASPLAQAYGLCLSACLAPKNTKGYVSLEVFVADLAARGIDIRNPREILSFDPAGGRTRDPTPHPAFFDFSVDTSKDADPMTVMDSVQTYSAAREVVGSKLTYGEYREFQRLSNVLVFARDGFWLRERFGADERCARWCVRAVWDSFPVEEEVEVDAKDSVKEDKKKITTRLGLVKWSQSKMY